MSRAAKHHALLELLWHTGARLGGIRALDLRDFHSEEGFVEFVHRPSTGTPLKNKIEGERMVGLRQPVVDVLEEYVEENRDNAPDEYGRSPLLATRNGRPRGRRYGRGATWGRIPVSLFRALTTVTLAPASSGPTVLRASARRRSRRITFGRVRYRGTETAVTRRRSSRNG